MLPKTRHKFGDDEKNIHSTFCIFCIASAISLPILDELFSDFHEYVQECQNSLKISETLRLQKLREISGISQITSIFEARIKSSLKKTENILVFNVLF